MPTKPSKSPKETKKRKKEEEVEEEEEESESGTSESENESDDDSSSGESSQEEEENSKSKKKTPSKSPNKSKVISKTPPKKSSSSSKSKEKKSSSSSGNPKKQKQPRKFERLEEARKAFKWWEASDLPDGINWKCLEHAGVIFPPPYRRHNIPFYYDGKPLHLNDEQEEIVTFYASMPEDGPQLGNPKTRPVFQKNFFEDFQETLPSGHPIKKFEKCDFEEIRRYLELQKTLKKAASEEEKALKKLQKEEQTLTYGYALLDGRMEKNGNFNMEPPGLFRGRGDHPKTGRLKQRCFPESVLLNLGNEAPVPRAMLPGHSWHSVRHDPTVTWLCSWNENVNNSTKYVMLAASSTFKGKSDMEKYQKAMKLRACIGRVRSDYTRKMSSKEKSERQLGTAMWIIDILALRVGGEKGDDEADTVGCCSLRKEHFTFLSDTDCELELEFLGKDSMLFKQTINFKSKGSLGETVYRNLKQFCNGKQPGDEVFETLDPPILNAHLSSLMPGLTAKVFRTFNASITLEKELPSAEELEGLSIQEKVIRYNAANREVAILCNHQRTVSKAIEQGLENLQEKLKTLLEQQKEMRDWVSSIRKGKTSKIPLKEDDKESAEKLNKKLESANALKDSARTNEERVSAVEKIEMAKAEIKAEGKRRFNEKHFFTRIPTEEQVETRLTNWAEQIRKLEVDIRNRDENKEVALGTSKINYMDPRISVAWCKRCEVPIDKIFAKTLRDKFNWAMAVPPDWTFES